MAKQAPGPPQPSSGRPRAKVCATCAEERPASWYSRSRRYPDGLKPDCCVCATEKTRSRMGAYNALLRRQEAGSADGHPRMAFGDFLGDGGLVAAFEAAGLAPRTVPERDTGDQT